MNKITRMFLICILLGSFQPMVALEQNSTSQNTSIKADYIPLVVYTVENMGYTYPPLTQSPGADPHLQKPSLYMLYKTDNGSIDAKEYIIRRYCGSAVFKTPGFIPDAGFHPIAPYKENLIMLPLLIQRYARYIHEKNKKIDNTDSPNSFNSFARLFFYADADEISKQQLYFWQRLQHYFYSEPKQVHPLIQSLQTDTMQKADNKPAKNPKSEFDMTNIFVDENITLEDLQEQLNKNIQFINGAYCVKNPELSAIPSIFRR